MKTIRTLQPFNAVSQEHNGNFYFVRKHDRELYDMLVDAESKTLTDLSSAGARLRDALEYFQKTALPDDLKDELYAISMQDGNRKGGSSPKLYDYQKVFENHPELRVNWRLFQDIRHAGNAFHHRDDNKLPRTYNVVCRGLSNMQQMLYYYYTGNVNIKYHRDRQPIDKYWICSTLPVGDNTACERQMLCISTNKGRSAQDQFCLLRQYADGNQDEEALREEKILSNKWLTLRKPQNLVEYKILDVRYDGDAPQLDKKRILCYDFGVHCPHPLSDVDVTSLSEEQKYRLLHDVANGVRELHESGYCHRNLQPDSVYVFFEKDSDYVVAKLVGFEYAKIQNDERTVYASVRDLHAGADNSAYFSRALLTALKNHAAMEHIDWKKEDIYSLGALFHLLMTGTPPGYGGFPTPELAIQADKSLTELITRMLSPAAKLRPDIDEVCKVVLEYYRLVEDER